ncbi:MAG: alpha-amylase family glycosyl hydrolase [Muribaculaceae bacterium]|nr:alpha-amylase family glycosyl hydrolase [Muribaculaceae bacterium]
MKLLRQTLLGAIVAMSALAANAATFIGDRKDFRDETIYFAMTTRFYDGDPTNNVCSWDKQDVQIAKNDPDWRGDFKGLIDKLDYIKALGFTAIWITPVVQNASGEDYHGYHAMDHSTVDLRYESRKEWGATQDVKFQDLIDAAHAKGIKIVLDVVLQHTGNFGEAHLNPLFTRSQNIKDQANVAASLIPNPEKFGANYFDQTGEKQYQERWKYFKNPQYEPNNYYHHYGTGWNWDEPTRWWGQIAGDCVDLNTENNAVAEYIVECYGNFIKMGVDAFRIDTSGHIAPLTFNKQFIPQFHAIAEQYRSKRLNGGDFFMFGEVCQRYQGTVVYRDQPNLSSYFYTWKSDQTLLDEYNGDAAWWRQQVLNEGHDSPVGPMAVCVKDTKDKPISNNVLMQNGAWHDPDYSQASGFNVIDFPMHYCFNNAASAVDIARKGDNKYNDASYNVVYVDSHDYCPGPNDGTRFNGGTEQWAENLSLMFTFRGIPCIYYGSEVEFKAGKPIDVGGENNKTPRSESGRAYFGAYLEGTVNATDFGVYTASGNVQKTLDADLAHHVRRLNMIRAAVPALRRGQYTFDGCSASGGWAFKRAYKDESFALVAINGGATFTGVPAGKYVDVVTGESYTANGGSITVSAPTNKGQLRVLVKDWNGGKIGEDGKFMYASSPVAHGGSVSFTDPGTTQYYTSEDATERPQVSFSPDGGSFKTETLTVTATLTGDATSGWYQVGNQSRVALTEGQSKQFTIGADMEYGQSVTVEWGADTYTGKLTYKKVDPNATISVYVTGKDGADISGTNMHAWTAAGDLFGGWPGKKLTETQVIDGRTFYYHTFDDAEPVNIIFNHNGAQTADITNITEDTFFEYDGGSGCAKIDVNVGPKAPVIRATPVGGSQFAEPIQVTLTVSPATDIYYTLDGSLASVTSTRYTGPISLTETTTINAYAANEVGETRTSFTYTKVDVVTDNEKHAYFSNTASWSDPYVYCWDDNNQEAKSFSGSWPGKKLTETVQWQGQNLYHFSFTEPAAGLQNAKIIFNNGNGTQTSDLDLVNNGIYNAAGQLIGTYVADTGIATPEVLDGLQIWVRGGQLVINSTAECQVPIAGIDGSLRYLPVNIGYNYYELPHGFYIVNSKKVVL